jgi:intein/homing endonuclease
MEIIKELYKKEHLENGLSYLQIQEKYKIPRGTWAYYCKKYNLNYDGRTYRCIDNYFESWTEINAYILGFLYADGCITNDGRVSILLSEKDIELLELIRNEICPTAKIIYSNYQNIKRSPQIKLRFSSKSIYKKLIELGFTLNKTETDCNILQLIPELYKSSFIRGYLDGDGNIRCQKRGKYWTKSVSFCNGNNQILLDIQDLFKNCLNIQGILREYTNKNVYYILEYNKFEDVFKICNFLYNNSSFSLERKRILANKVIELYNNTEVTTKVKNL